MEFGDEVVGSLTQFALAVLDTLAAMPALTATMLLG